MPAVIQTTQTWADGDQVTSSKLINILGGSSFTNDAVVGTTLTVVGGQMKVGTITSSEMGSASVTATALAASAVETAKLADGAVTTVKLGNLSVTGAKIAAGTITRDKVADSAYAVKATMEQQLKDYVTPPSSVKFSPSSAKAHGSFLTASTARNIRANSFNITSLTRVSSTQTTILLATNMNSTNYTVVACFESDGSETGEVAVYDKTAGSFKIRHPSESAGRAVNFTVFGTYA